MTSPDFDWDSAPPGTQHRESRTYTMSLDLRRIAFAEAMGWKHSPIKGNPNRWKHGDGRLARSVKDLPMVTLQVVHDLESRLSRDQAHDYMRYLIQALKRDRKDTNWDRHLYCFAMAHASLAHREEAILMTLGLWIPF
jgi:hypothetical protein